MIDDNLDDKDLDAPEDFEKERAEKPSLKEIWDNNPPLKIVAIVLVLVLGLGVYVFMSGEAPPDSKINLKAVSKQTPGTSALDPEYQRAMEEANQRDAQERERAGLSHLDIPTNIPNSGGLQVPQMPEQPRSDVLEEWKRVADQGRMKAAKEAVDEENQAPAPEVVPMVQPIRPQEMKADPGMSKRLADQMRKLLESQIPPKSQNLTVTNEESPYRVMKEKKSKGEAEGGKSGSAGGQDGSNADGTANASPKIIVPAGNVAYAQLLTTLNSDLPGPVLAQVLSGPFTGGRLIGKLTANEECECLIIEYKTVVKDTISYSINAVALDQETTLAGVTATDVDHHYFVRYVLPAAASFLTGYSQALSQTGQTQTTSLVGTTTASPAPSPKQSIFSGVTTASQAISDDLNEDSDRKPTIVVAQGTTMGIFFTDAVTTGDAGK